MSARKTVPRTSLMQLHDAIRFAKDQLADAVEDEFPAGSIVHVEHGSHRWRAVVESTYNARVWLRGRTGKTYVVDAWRLAEFHGR